jgi:hypothetical protein
MYTICRLNQSTIVYLGDRAVHNAVACGDERCVYSAGFYEEWYVTCVCVEEACPVL